MRRKISDPPAPECSIGWYVFTVDFEGLAGLRIDPLAINVCLLNEE
jgi:hypothetical protein